MTPRTDSGPDDEAPPRANGLLVFLATGVGLFMAGLDNLVITVALPSIQRDLDTDIAGLGWITNAYTLTFAVFLFIAAVVGDRLGRRTVYLTGLGLFTAASAVAALADSVSVLVAARALQGLGAAMIVPLSLTLLVTGVARRRRGLAIAGWSMMSGIAVALGPFVGGVIVEFGDWPMIFWVNVPIGLALLPVAAFSLRESYGPATRMDPVGLIMVGLGMLGVVYGLILTTAEGWASPMVLLSLAGGAAVLLALTVWERRASSPMLPPRLFRSRGFTLANLVALLVTCGMFGVVFLLTQYLQNVLGYEPLSAGVRTLPWTLAPVVIAPLTAPLADRFGTRPFMVLGTLLQGLALVWFALTVDVGTPYAMLVPGLLAAGSAWECSSRSSPARSWPS
ncbi:DHA2 family efflux MFS transporter permease subunit [Nocardiopsis sp. ARC36]